jgi:hypothetical protein
MTSAIHRFIKAHEYCVALEQVLDRAIPGSERDVLHEELLAAYQDLEAKTQALVHARFAQSAGWETN